MAEALIRAATDAGVARRRIAIAALPLLIAACHGHGSGGETDAARPRPEALAGLGEGEAVHMLGTEPFWNANIRHGMLTYTTPEITEATPVPVSRFVGLGGLGFSGTLRGKPLQIAVSQAPCSDGMSDRNYPFTVTFRIGDEDRTGCGWAGDDARPAAAKAALQATR